ncbi:hypothetical protein [Wolbachia endosymbiont of Wuchereria bancrofti]|uniref:hypothetical protein n=1 Tax=Wolbachia endosymbiont of Wuchereria bancrofti TaxID=96496 RepID=UPI00034977C1|nr:hypothetical protein [Wolbachia endosymbiont of Wuchereria bancrofti]
MNIDAIKPLIQVCIPLKLKNGEELSARYIFTYRWRDNKWLISSHHSLLPPMD